MKRRSFLGALAALPPAVVLAKAIPARRTVRLANLNDALKQHLPDPVPSGRGTHTRFLNARRGGKSKTTTATFRAIIKAEYGV